MITTVIFDMDDTLYDELEYCKSGFAAVSDFILDSGRVADPAGTESIFACLWAQFTAGNRKETFNAALDKLGINYDDDFISQLVSVYRRHEPSLALPEDSRKVLEELKSKYTLAMLTDGFLPAQQLKARALGIEDYFECIVYTEELGREFWKPAPEGFNLILESLGLEAGNCVYVADNIVKDFIGPNKLGMATVQLIRPNRIHSSAPESSEPDSAAGNIIEGIEQLPALLERL